MVENLFHAREEQAANTAGGGSSVGQNIRVLNTLLTNDIPGATLIANQISLNAGTYEVLAYAPGYRPDRHRLNLYNVTDAAIEVIGGVQFSQNATSFQQNHVVCFGRFTLAATKTLEMRHYMQKARSTDGLGLPVNDGRLEVYTDVMIREVISPFDMIHVREEQTTGTEGGGSSTGENIRVLNTVVTNTIAGASLAANRITLPAGTYQIEGNSPHIHSSTAVLWARNVTDPGNPEVATGLPVHVSTSSLARANRSFIYDQFLLEDTKDIEIVLSTEAGFGTNGLGAAVSDGDTEVYTDIVIRLLVEASPSFLELEGSAFNVLFEDDSGLLQLE